MSAQKRLILSFLVLVCVFVVGSVGYVVLEEGVTFGQAAYMTVITISTVGYKEAVELDRAGQIWTILVILFGVGTASVAFSSVVSLLVSGEIRTGRERRRMQAQIDHLSKHVIICGYGRMGSLVAGELRREKMAAVIVESSESVCRSLEEAGVLHVCGDATEEETLLKAGLPRARVLVPTLPTDADNVYVTLTARGLCPDLRIIARAEQPSAEVKLRRAGANNVVCSQIIGASRIAHLIARPHVVEFTEVAARGVELEVSEYEVGPQSTLKDSTLRASNLRRQTGGMVVALKRANGEMLFSPSPDEPIREGDILVVIGTSGVTARLATLSD